MKQYFISLDVGGTHCRIGLLENEGKKLHLLSQVMLKVKPDFEAGVKDLAENILKISKGYKIQSIGGSFPGLVVPDAESIRAVTNLPEWDGQPLKKKIETLTQIPTHIFHDSAAAAMGEALYGNGVGSGNFVFLIWGTGFGGAKVEQLQSKYHISSFEPGHHVADRKGEECSCGLRGCPELVIGGASLAKKLGKELSAISDNDPIWDMVAEAAGQAVLNTLAFHQTPLIIFGGGLILHRPFLIEKLQKIVDKEQHTFLKPKLKIAKLGDDAALYGAVALQQVELI